jgi:transcriptional regulator with XRE-family HTH domain
MAYRPLPLGPIGETVRANVQQLRKARGLSQAALAAKIAAARAVARGPKIQAIEAGFRRVDVDDLAALAAGLDVRPEQLLAPWQCETCHGQPAPRFTCRDCGTEGA